MWSAEVEHEGERAGLVRFDEIDGVVREEVGQRAFEFGVLAVDFERGVEGRVPAAEEAGEVVEAHFRRMIARQHAEVPFADESGAPAGTL